MNNEIFLSLLNSLFIIKENSNVFVKYVFYFTRKVKNMYISYKYFPLYSMKLKPYSTKNLNILYIYRFLRKPFCNNLMHSKLIFKVLLRNFEQGSPLKSG